MREEPILPVTVIWRTIIPSIPLRTEAEKEKLFDLKSERKQEGGFNIISPQEPLDVTFQSMFALDPENIKGIQTGEKAICVLTKSEYHYRFGPLT